MSVAPCSAFRPRSGGDATTCGACGWSEAAHRRDDELKDWRARYALATTKVGRKIARRALTDLGETAEGFAHLDKLADPIR
jgi:hypothetical protein